MTGISLWNDPSKDFVPAVTWFFSFPFFLSTGNFNKGKLHLLWWDEQQQSQLVYLWVTLKRQNSHWLWCTKVRTMCFYSLVLLYLDIVSSVLLFNSWTLDNGQLFPELLSFINDLFFTVSFIFLFLNLTSRIKQVLEYILEHFRVTKASLDASIRPSSCGL